MYLRSMTAQPRPVLRLVPHTHRACCTLGKMDWHAARFETRCVFCKINRHATRFENLHYLFMQNGPEYCSFQIIDVSLAK